MFDSVKPLVIVTILILVSGTAFLYWAGDKESALSEKSDTESEEEIKFSLASVFFSLNPLYRESEEKETKIPDLFITYSDNGFNQNILETKTGETLRFYNQSAETLYLFSPNSNDAPQYQGLSTQIPIKPKEAFDLIVVTPGLFTIENMEKTHHRSSLIIRR